MQNDKISREQFYDLIWSKPITEVAKIFHVSDSAIHKLCKKYEVPKPPAGHWAKLKYGKQSPQIPLPQTEKVFEEFRLGEYVERAKKDNQSMSEFALKLVEIEADQRLIIDVPLRLLNPDPLIMKVEEAFAASIGTYHLSEHLLGHYENCLDIKVSKEQLQRFLRICDTLIKNLRIRGHGIIIRNSESYLVMYGEEIPIKFREITKRKPAEVVNGRYYFAEYLPTSLLAIRLNNISNTEWKDGKIRLEDQIIKILAKLEVYAYKRKLMMDKNREDWAKREIELELQKRIREEAKQEELRFNALLLEAEQFVKAKQLREYIQGVEKLVSEGVFINGKSIEWLEWAKGRLKRYDPLACD